MHKPTCRSRLRESSSSDEHDAVSFTLFPQLPLELRHAIWRYTLPRPRRIIGEQRRSDPIALSINRESRQLALSYYKRHAFHPDHKFLHTQMAVAPGGTSLKPRYIDYSFDFIHDDWLLFFPKHLTENVLSEFADSPALEGKILGHLQDRLWELPRLREVLVVVHYRHAYQAFKQTESQMEKKLQLMRSRIVKRLGRLKMPNESEGHIVLQKTPNVVMEVCQPCFRRRGSRHYVNTWCRGHLNKAG
jgi:hypothetical protein